MVRQAHHDKSHCHPEPVEGCRRVSKGGSFLVMVRQAHCDITMTKAFVVTPSVCLCVTLSLSKGGSFLVRLRQAQPDSGRGWSWFVKLTMTKVFVSP